MSVLEQVYKCDADGCERQEAWGAGVAERWLTIEVSGTSWGARRPRCLYHACSSPCERRIHAKLAHEPMTAEQAELEARALRPDLAKRLEDLEAHHIAELGRVQQEALRDREELDRLRAARFAPSPPVTHDELRGMLQALIGAPLSAAELRGLLVRVLLGRSRA